ncbi:MAG TPA: rRNA methyltransferase [Candidatus Omnitrophica bacterium]|nr:rRNA methyltransferase [Candidatus Omnitrophota bacterium]HCI44936.1 rRNA methyltransferase [Candidatus Omnitrophota bacterium]
MPRDKIISLTNPRVKELVRLRTAGHRKSSGVTIVDGAREVLRALGSGVKFREFYVCPELVGNGEEEKQVKAKLSATDVPVFEVTKSVFTKIAYGDRQEGVLGVCETPRRSLTDFRVGANALVVVVEQVEKPGNLGAILRTCDGAGVNGVLVCDSKTDLYNPNVIRASVGTIFTVNTVLCSAEEASCFLKNKGIKIYAASPGAHTIYTQMDLTGPVAFVLGGEQEGLSDFWEKNADARVKIPMRGAADSLNVSTSAAILIYEALRQRLIGYGNDARIVSG